MKKTKVISLSIILLSLSVLHSCRQDEMDIAPENNNLVEKEYQEKVHLKTENDSTQTTASLYFDEKGNEIVDPPPKDKDQW
ncbi:hypothetical protein [Sphingobacterium athyrii]|uniref:Lipoprotein n=1 Tax=Sphingobacterium athyrii TaxID=2152717 RepID=A0A363NUK0_9SPHI|nr:hypothetical protein [Sphingobacterium athyrii]PUV24403.1 hypothetical protein DCO56_13745 [Sphingobacterium athyrii]